jgi:hypothetical protein
VRARITAHGHRGNGVEPSRCSTAKDLQSAAIASPTLSLHKPGWPRPFGEFPECGTHRRGILTVRLDSRDRPTAVERGDPIDAVAQRKLTPTSVNEAQGSLVVSKQNSSGPTGGRRSGEQNRPPRPLLTVPGAGRPTEVPFVSMRRAQRAVRYGHALVLLAARPNACAASVTIGPTPDAYVCFADASYHGRRGARHSPRGAALSPWL